MWVQSGFFSSASSPFPLAAKGSTRVRTLFLPLTPFSGPVEVPFVSTRVPGGGGAAPGCAAQPRGAPRPRAAGGVSRRCCCVRVVRESLQRELSIACLRALLLQRISAWKRVVQMGAKI